jgi:predicted AAA+ superfamily ATPase
MAQAIPPFLKSLFELAAGNPKVVVIITLATQADAYGRETEELTELMNGAEGEFQGALADTQSLLARTVSVIKPAEDAEIVEILKRRLFAEIDGNAASEAAGAYKAYYEDLAGRGETFSGGAEQPATYGDLVARSYPFHPELVRVLDKRIGSISNFNRARGALKLLAEVVAGVWQDKRDVEILNVADVDFRRSAVLSHLTVGIDRPDFEQVARVDFVGPNSHAATVDATRFAGHAPYATRA